MTVKMNVCPCCFAVSPRDPGTALGQASRCPHCGESAVMDPDDQIDKHAPWPRRMPIGSDTPCQTAATEATKAPSGRAQSGPIGQFVFGTFAFIGLALCLLSGIAAAWLCYLEVFQNGAYGPRSDVFPIHLFYKFTVFAAVFGIALAGAVLQSFFGSACRRWPKGLLWFGFFPAMLGVAPLIILILMAAAVICAAALSK